MMRHFDMEQNTCTICGAKYTRTYPRQVTCLRDECRKANALALARRHSKKRRKREVAAKPWRVVIKCRICGVEFLRERWNQNTCSDLACKKISNNWGSVRSSNLEPRECKCCGDTYTPNSRNQIICGKESCYRWRKNQGRGRQLRVEAATGDAAPRPTMATLGAFSMPCPWATPGKLGSGPEGVSWYSAQADPMTRGIWVTGNLETVRVREVAA